MPEMDFPSFLSDAPRYLFPQLTRAELGIEKSFDQTGFGSLLAEIGRFSKGRRKCMPDRFCDGQPLDSLRPPFGRDLGAGYTPDLFRVVLEKGAIQPISEPMDKKILQRHIGRLPHET